MAWVINITKHTTTTACGILRSEEAPAGRMEPAGVRRAQAAGANAGSERDANATLRGAGAALVGHHHALDRAEHGHVAAGAVVEADAGDGADGAAAARRHERQVLAEQHGVDASVADALECDHAAVDIGLELAAGEA